MTNDGTVCAVVVTHNRKKLLIECIDSLINQSKPLDAIYIIDNNSTDNTPQLLKEKDLINEIPLSNHELSWEKKVKVNNREIKIKLHYYKMHKNTGGAGGFYEGVKRAYEDGYDWLWLMDDDAEPVQDALKFLNENTNIKNISALCSTVTDINNHIQLVSRGFLNFNRGQILKFSSKEDYGKQYVEIDMASFVGILIKRDAINKAGFPKKELFIQGDDLEYCIRLGTYGKILLITDSIIIHKNQRIMKEIKKKRFFRISLRPSYENLWLYYFSPRNMTWINKVYGENRIFLYYFIIKAFILVSIGIILYDDNKLKRINLFKEAYIDGIKGNFDNNKPKILLYD
jgi:GT2 family glycosyltransferase